MNSFWQDVRYGLRTFAKSPGFTAVAILTLALGIAATTTIFNVIDSVLLHPFPYKDVDRLVTTAIRLPDPDTITRFPVGAFLDFKEQNHTFEDMIGLASLLGVNTYLGPEVPRNQVTVDVSDVGRYDVVMEMPSLDPRMDGGWNAAEYGQPIARISAPAAVRPGDPIMLQGEASIAPPGRTITQYVWTLAPPQS